MDGIYLCANNSTVRPCYYDCLKDAVANINEFCDASDHELDQPVLVTIDEFAGTLLDGNGHDWAINLKSQSPEAII